MATSKHLIDTASRHQVYLERLKAGFVKDYGQVLRDLDTAVRDVLGALDVELVSELKKSELNQLLKDLKAAQVEIYKKWSDELLANLEELSGHEIDYEMKATTSAVIHVKMTAPASVAVFKVVSERPIAATGDLLAPFVRDFTATEMDAVEKLVRRAYYEGMTVQQATIALRGRKALNYQDGILGRNERRAATIIRTAVQHVAQTTRAEVWKSNDDVVIGYRWVATLDSKTSPQCRSLDGQVFKIDRGPLPPLHPGCRSTTTPEIDPKYNLNDGAGTRSSANGYVPEDMTYYEWLKTQPASFQDDAIGPTRGKLLRDGGLSADEFARLNLGRNFEPLTLDEMRRKSPSAFKHAGI